MGSTRLELWRELVLAMYIVRFPRLHIEGRNHRVWKNMKANPPRTFGQFCGVQFSFVGRVSHQRPLQAGPYYNSARTWKRVF
jgi:hypothetical protein